MKINIKYNNSLNLNQKHYKKEKNKQIKLVKKQ